MTFDGKDYTFNARGEFRLLISTRYNFILQGRFERPPNATCKYYFSLNHVLHIKNTIKFSLFRNVWWTNKRYTFDSNRSQGRRK